MVTTIEAYKDGDSYIVAGLDAERDEVFLDCFESSAQARGVAEKLHQRYPQAAWDVSL